LPSTNSYQIDEEDEYGDKVDSIEKPYHSLGNLDLEEAIKCKAGDCEKRKRTAQPEESSFQVCDLF